MNEENDVRRSISSRMFAPHAFALVLGVMLCFLVDPVSARDSCSPTQSNQAVYRLKEARKSWKTLRVHQKIFAACDDGELAEGYSDAVVTLFAQNWSHFGQFVALARDDAAFQRWTMKHIDASASTDDLKKIVEHTSRCTVKADEKELCSMIRESAEAALSEIEQVD
ncbi:hypothetical protein P3W23_18290 [Luteibacter sp. PPL554]